MNDTHKNKNSLQMLSLLDFEMFPISSLSDWLAIHFTRCIHD